MTLHCGCENQGDDIVFGVPHRCEGVHTANLQAELDRLERDDPEVYAASAGLDAVYEHLKGRLPSGLVAEIYNAPLDPPRLIPSWVFTVPTEDPADAGHPCSAHGRTPCWSCLKDQPVLRAKDPAEPRYMETLDLDERGGR